MSSSAASLDTHPRAEALEDITVAGKAVAGLRPPLLSFVVVNWNYGQFIEQTLDSIKNQDYPDFECVIVDNGSSDNSVEVIERYTCSDSRFSLIRLSHNIGQLGGAFRGIRAVSGPFVAIIDADDVLFPTFASTHIQVHLSLVHTAALTSSNVIEVASNNSALSSTCWPSNRQPSDGKTILRDEALAARIPQISADSYRDTLARCVSRAPREEMGWLWSPGTSNVMRRSIATLFVYDDAQPAMIPSDSYFLKLCHVFGGSAFIDIPLSSRRIHDTNYFATREQVSEVRIESRSFAEKINEIDPNIENMRAFLKKSADNYWVLGSYFWIALDSLTDRVGLSRIKYFNSKRVVDLFCENARDLLLASGSTVFLWAIASRFSILNGRKIVRSAFEGRLPLGFYLWMALPVRFMPQAWWKKLARWLR